tara:strand:- start:1051 stop:1347 length:297 start_codon:yes stop_codon:yes gene_type:complete
MMKIENFQHAKNLRFLSMRKLKRFFKSFKKGMGNFGQNIALIINTILLTLVYLIGAGLTSIFAKIFRKHFLDMKLSKDTYWSNLNLKKKHLEEYYRQF